MLSTFGLPGAFVVVWLATLPLKQARVVFCLASGVMTWLVLVQGTRTFSPDVLVYRARYESLVRYSQYDIASGQIEVLRKDRVFWMLSKVFSEAGITAQIWTALLSAAFAASASFFIAKNSRAPLISFVALTALGYTLISGAALRQSLALSATLLAVHLIIRRRRKLAVAPILIAALFHSTALIVLLAIPVSRTSRIRTLWVGVAAALVIVVSAPSAVRFAIRGLGWTDELSAYYSTTNSLSWILFVLHAVVAVVASMMMRRLQSTDPDRTMLGLVILALPFYAIATVVAESFRLGLYFSIVEVALVANVATRVKDPPARLFTYITIMITLIGYGAVTGAASV